MTYDVVIVGGGPAGLAAALVLGRSRRRTLVCDGGARRNAAADHVSGFLTRDGTPPAELRRIGRAQLVPYGVEVREVRVEDITGARDRFEVRLEDGDAVGARRVVLCAGVIDEIPELPGFRELWGRAVLLCPYCDGWEVRDRALGYLAPSAEWVEHAAFLQCWSGDVVLFTDGRFEVPAEARALLASRGVPIEERRVRGLIVRGSSEPPAPEAVALEAVELEGGARVPRDALFAKPPQRQVELVGRLGLALDPQGAVHVDDHQQSSRRGIFVAGDASTHAHTALGAAASGALTAQLLNHELEVGHFTR